MLRKLLSYLYPLTRKVPSAINGPLEVTLVNGRKVLDSRSANYSYGSLQRVLRHGLRQLELAGVRQALLLGLGGGSVMETLRAEFGYAGHLTAVELDPAMIAVAAREFGVVAGPDLAIVCADAFAYVRTAPALAFDLIIVDLSIDSAIPPAVFSLPFWRALNRLLRPGGQVLLNAIHAEAHRALTAALRGHAAALGLKLTVLERVEKINQLVLARKPEA